jgi:hypothetical protein
MFDSFKLVLPTAPILTPALPPIKLLVLTVNDLNLADFVPPRLILSRCHESWGRWKGGEKNNAN